MRVNCLLGKKSARGMIYRSCKVSDDILELK
jgi:hypothetical protein